LEISANYSVAVLSSATGRSSNAEKAVPVFGSGNHDPVSNVMSCQFPPNMVQLKERWFVPWQNMDT